jgi:hypothetical protein
MKTIAIITGVLLSSGVFSQDMINTTDGRSISAKVLEVGSTEVKYKNSTNQDGPVYVMNKSDINSIKYSNGTEDVFSQTNQTSSDPQASNNDNKVNGYNTDPNGGTGTSSSSNGGYASSVPSNGTYGRRNYSWVQPLVLVAVNAALNYNRRPHYYGGAYPHSCGHPVYGRHR